MSMACARSPCLPSLRSIWALRVPLAVLVWASTCFSVISGFFVITHAAFCSSSSAALLAASFLPAPRAPHPAGADCDAAGDPRRRSIILSPSETREFAGSALASLVSAANVFFHDRTNYFADAAHYRPLLHTWSLSLEEQFYLLFPLILGVLVVRARNPRAHLGLFGGPVAGLVRGGGLVPRTPCLLHADGAFLGARCGRADRLRGGAPG